ncbi:hypothetical protein FB451DRAFT_1567536 [Mycena latifolia]|nr:hypothetical protein FB451DRAFT_1567536 [Mycena latifolia]
MSMPQSHLDEACASVADLLTARARTHAPLLPPPSRALRSALTQQPCWPSVLCYPCSTLKHPLTDRILASFVSSSLYAPHPIAMNPSKSVLVGASVKEREKALASAKTGGITPNEPLLWILWKILTSEGEDLAPYSPETLARSVLPPSSRATELMLDGLTHADNDARKFTADWHHFNNSRPRVSLLNSRLRRQRLNTRSGRNNDEESPAHALVSLTSGESCASNAHASASALPSLRPSLPSLHSSLSLGDPERRAPFADGAHDSTPSRRALSPVEPLV